MTYKTIYTSVQDEALRHRVQAGAVKEAIANPVLAETEFGDQLRRNPVAALNVFMWPVAVDNEAAYEFALGNNNPNPGDDAGVITDGNIQAGIQAHWPADPVSEPVIPN